MDKHKEQATTMTTKYIPITPLNFHSEIRVDTHGDEVTVTVYNCDINHLDLLIQQLEALKAEHNAHQADITYRANLGAASLIDDTEPPQMTAVLGPKVIVDDFGNKFVNSEPAKRSDPTTHYTCAETATFIRQALKKAFPVYKFTVRSKVYSGGASITIGWLDGMTEHEVKQVVSRFEGATFDGMIDLKSNVYYNDENGTNVSYGADYIFCNREYSKELTLKLAAQVANFESIDLFSGRQSALSNPNRQLVCHPTRT